MAVPFHHRTLPWRLVALDVPRSTAVARFATRRCNELGSCGSWARPRQWHWFSANKEALFSQRRHDLTRRQRGVLRLVAGEKDPLASFLTQPVPHEDGTAFTAVLAVPITQKSLPLALEGAQRWLAFCVLQTGASGPKE
jgi:hypothetical protein